MKRINVENKRGQQENPAPIGGLIWRYLLFLILLFGFLILLRWLHSLPEDSSKSNKEGIDLIVLAGYLAIIGEDLIKEYKNKIINIHPSLIPSFCGAGYYGLHVHEACFKRGCKVSGATVHFVSAVVDGGPIILQRSIDISDCKTPEEIQEKILVNIEHKLLKEAVALYCDNKLQVINERVEII